MLCDNSTQNFDFSKADQTIVSVPKGVSAMERVDVKKDSMM